MTRLLLLPKPTPKLKGPRFSEQIGDVVFVTGSNAAVTHLDRLRTHKEIVLQVGRLNIIMMYAEGNDLYVDAVIYSVDGINKTIYIERNKLIGKPAGWDLNSDEGGMEVIDDKGEVVFRLDYETTTKVVVGGLFIIGGKSYFMNEHGWFPGGKPEAVPSHSANGVPQPSSIKRIFKHPSTRFPGQRID